MLDPKHTSITFFAQHLGYADLAGMFLEADGSFRFDEEARELCDLRIVVRTASVFTNHERRYQHLRTRDFLDVEAFPEMIFEARHAADRHHRAHHRRSHPAWRHPADDA